MDGTLTKKFGGCIFNASILPLIESRNQWPERIAKP